MTVKVEVLPFRVPPSGARFFLVLNPNRRMRHPADHGGLLVKDELFEEEHSRSDARALLENCGRQDQRMRSVSACS